VPSNGTTFDCEIILDRLNINPDNVICFKNNIMLIPDSTPPSEPTQNNDTHENTTTNQTVLPQDCDLPGHLC